VFIDPDDNITNKGTAFRDTERLWELLTRKIVSMVGVKKADLMSCTK